MAKAKLKLRVLIGTSTEPVTVVGRDAWALKELIAGGIVGVTPIERPAPRWAHYVFKLRGKGFRVETIEEKHGGPFAGTHARYVLRSPVTILSEPKAA